MLMSKMESKQSVDLFMNLKAWDVNQIKKDLYRACMQCNLRGLKKTAAWLEFIICILFLIAYFM